MLHHHPLNVVRLFYRFFRMLNEINITLSPATSDSVCFSVFSLILCAWWYLMETICNVKYQHIMVHLYICAQHNNNEDQSSSESEFEKDTSYVALITKPWVVLTFCFGEKEHKHLRVHCVCIFQILIHAHNHLLYLWARPCRTSLRQECINSHE